MSRVRRLMLGFLIPVVVLIVWWYVTTFTDTPKSILPALPDVGRTFMRIWGSGQLPQDLSVSLLRVVKGYIAAVFLGMLLGSIMGMSGTFRAILLPVLTTVRQIPVIAWIPLIILWCGIGELSKVVIIVIAAFFPIMVNTFSGIAETPEGYLEVARLYKLGRWKTFLKVYLPYAVPQIQVGLKLGLGISWMAVVAAELVSSTSGIGYRMSDARSLMQSDVVIICMIVIGIMGILMDKGLSLLFGAVTPWKKERGGIQNG